MNTDILKGLALMGNTDFVMSSKAQMVVDNASQGVNMVHAMDSMINNAATEAFHNTCVMFVGTDEQRYDIVMTKLNELYMDALEGSCVDPDYGVKSQQWYNNFVNNLKAYNFEVLGSGHFAMAVSHPFIAGKVVKIGFKVEDSGAAYAAYCRNEKNQFISEILALRRNSDCYMVVMPKYHTFNGMLDAEDDGITENDKRALVMSYGLVKRVVDYGDKDWDSIQYSMVDRSCRGKVDILRSNIKLLDSRIEDFKALFDAALSIRLYFEDIACFDIHDENVMVKWAAGRPQLVITDPVSWTRG